MPPPKDGLPRKRPRLCAVCRHEERARIEALLAAGLSLDKLSAKFGLHRDALHRHWHRHVDPVAKTSLLIGPGKLQALAEVCAEEGGSTLDHLRILRGILFGALERKARDRDDGTLPSISNQILKTLRAISTLTGEISSIANTLNVTHNHLTIVSSDPFRDLQDGLLRLAASHPGARGDIVALLKGLDEKYAAAAPQARPARTIEAASVSEAQNAI
ncbi:MAG TPA: hypothetical protein VIF88_12470 [Methylocystis sp.]|jgi:hypothetical protein